MMSSLTVFAGMDGCVTSMFAVDAKRTIGVKSLSVSYGSFEMRLGFTACENAGRSNVYPSGGAFATASLAMVPPAPGRMSTIICWPHFWVSFWPTVRDATSLGPPAANPTSRRMGFAGYCCPNAAEHAATRVATHAVQLASHLL